MLNVKDCMTQNVITANRGMPLKNIIKMFKENKVHTLPVINEESRIVGKITLNEIVTVFQPQSAEINQLLKTVPFLDTVPEQDIEIDYITPEMGILVVADEIMTKDYSTIRPENSVSKAYSVMKFNDTKILMVTDEDNKLVGILAMFDIIYSLFKEKGVID